MLSSLLSYVLTGIVYYLKCAHANNHQKHGEDPILIYPNYIQRKDTRSYTSQSIQHGHYIYLGGDYACERELIERYTSDLISTSYSWQKQVDSLNNLAFNTSRSQAVPINMRRFSQIVFTFKIIEMDLCLGSTVVTTPREIDQFDMWAWSQYPRLMSRFIYLWSNHKTLIGPCNIGNNKCLSCFTIDGHQKARRRICRTKQVDYQSSDFTEPLVIGCWRTPIRHSLYCEIHQDYQKLDETNKTNRKGIRTYKLRNSRQWKRQKTIFFGATNCNTNKAKSASYVNKCSRSFGLLAMVTNCKIVLSFSEIFRSETLREIVQLIINTIRIGGDALPKIACYDDGCHLVKFVQKNIGKLITNTPASDALKNTKFYIDKAHWKNHIGTWCKANMSPYSSSGISANLVPDAPTVSLPHAASALENASNLPPAKKNDLITNKGSTITAHSTTIDGNKWIEISNNIEFNIKSTSTKTIRNVSDTIDNKWTAIASTINSLQPDLLKKSKTRTRSYSTINKWTLQAEQVRKQVKHEIYKSSVEQLTIKIS
ncbi:unnamed protein product [Rotaria sp. Silwood2]|nr:unnamed protein product [Rotaria sp. Silwood2]CAF4535610.1 unnamed protein product [Rotaria sp. Silwood2]